MTILAVAILLIVTLLAIALTLITLPGTWFLLGIALLMNWLYGDPQLINTWNLIACGVVALLGEIAELALSAAGSSRRGGGKSGAIGSILGGLIGAIAGTMIVPILGTIVGGVLGAGLGALVLERGIAQRSWEQAARIGQGAAVGRAVSLLVKTALTAVIGISLTIDALIR